MPGLRVTCGNVGQMKEMAVNRDVSAPFPINNELFDGFITVRLKGFEGPKGSDGPEQPESGYFDKHTSLTWSIAIAGRVKRTFNGDALLFGNTFDRPIRDNLPYGTAIALKAFRLIDPSLVHDLYADKPWAFSPFIATMPFLNVSKRSGDPPWSADQPSEDVSGFYAADDGRRDQLSGNPAARRRVFGNAAARSEVEITPEHYIQGDFAQGMIDFAHLSLTIPIVNLSFDLTKYWDGQPVRFVAQERASGKEGERPKELFRVEFVIVDEEIVKQKIAAGHEVAGAPTADDEATLNDEID